MGRHCAPYASHHRRWLGLHHRLFAWFGLTILVTLGAAIVTGGLFLGHRESDQERLHDRPPERVGHFVAARFEEVWEEPARREALARAMSEDLGLGVELRSVDGSLLSRNGPPCSKRFLETPVARGGERLGSVGLCVRSGGAHWGLGAVLAVIAFTLWLATGALARHLARPLRELARVTGEIGAGKLSSRARLGWHQPGEVGVLAQSINDMAVRIERQMADQRELLAAVSHEVRTPLGHLAVLAELLRERGADPDLLREVEREIAEVDRLVDELLASSRLEFSALSLRALDAIDVARRSLERSRLDPELLEVVVEDSRLEADANLLARALANLLDNARKHGGGVTALRVTEDRERNAIVFMVDDVGAGFREVDLQRAFESFYRGEASNAVQGSLGLGLALVRRIAQAHGGDAWAENREQGARVALWVPRGEPNGPRQGRSESVPK